LIGTKEGLYEINITKDIKGMAVIFKHEVLNDTVPNPENDDDIELEEVFEPYFKEKTVRFT
jgi:homoserine dehydrogenase